MSNWIIEDVDSIMELIPFPQIPPYDIVDLGAWPEPVEVTWPTHLFNEHGIKFILDRVVCTENPAAMYKRQDAFELTWFLDYYELLRLPQEQKV